MDKLTTMLILKSKNILLFALGIIDILSMGKIRGSIPNILVFHDIVYKRNSNKITKPNEVSFARANKLVQHLTSGNVFSRNINCVFTFDDSLKSIIDIIHKILSANGQVIIFINSDRIDKDNSKYLTREDLMELIGKKEGSIEIGNHLYNHPDCRNISIIHFENLLKNDAKFFEELGVRSDKFAWPFGKANKTFISTLNSFGYFNIYVGEKKKKYKYTRNEIARVQVSELRYSKFTIRGQLLIHRVLACKTTTNI